MATAIATAIATAGVDLELTAPDRLAAALATADIGANNNTDGSVVIRGTIARKRKYRDHVSLAIRTIESQPPKLVMVPRYDSSMPLEGCFLGTVVEIRLEPQKSSENDGKVDVNDDNTSNNSHRLAQTLNILRSSPDPNAIQFCLKLVSEGKLPNEIFSCDLIETPGVIVLLLKDANQADDILSLGPKDPLRKAFVKRLSSGLKGEPIAINNNDEAQEVSTIAVRPRRRPAHIKLKHRKILEKMEASQYPLDPIHKPLLMPNNDDETEEDASLSHAASSNATTNAAVAATPTATDTDNAAATDAVIYNLPVPNDATMKSGRHPKTRREYLHDKKWPQIKWLVKRLAPILEQLREKQQQQQQDTDNKETKRLEILDVGGGRGDLAVAVVEAFPDVRVTVVDLNETSLEGGRVYYHSRKPSDEEDKEDRVRFVCGDFAEYARGAFDKHENENKSCNDHVTAAMGNSNSDITKRRFFDVVVAWHACGDLSDYALEFAVKDNGANASAFVICPCCYTKRYISSFEPKWIGDYCRPCTPASSLSSATAAVDATKSDNSLNNGSSTTDTQENNSDGDIRTIQRLAEINERPEITSRAMGLINTMRLRSLLALSSSQQQLQKEHQSHPTFDITLEKYDLSYSSKNLVLVGIKK